MVFLFLEIQRRLMQAKVHNNFFLLWKETTHKSSNPLKAFLQCTCYWYNLLRSMFFILYDYSKTLFFSKVHRYPDALFSHVFLLSLKQVIWKKSVFYLHNTKFPKWSLSISYLLNHAESMHFKIRFLYFYK